MRAVKILPPAFQRYQEIGGALDFTVFEHSMGTMEESLSAISEATPCNNGFKLGALRRLGYRLIDERAFFGDWYDADTGKIKKLGCWQIDDGTELKDPVLENLDGLNIVSGGITSPEAGSGGEFAYAFSFPPHMSRRTTG